MQLWIIFSLINELSLKIIKLIMSYKYRATACIHNQTHGKRICCPKIKQQIDSSLNTILHTHDTKSSVLSKVY